MAPIFPLAKLAFLFVKQVARPLSSRIRRGAIRNAFFKEKICLPPARLYHWCEVRMKMYVMNITRSKESAPIPRLNEEAAIELGANLLGEGVIFGIAVAILAFEVGRQKEKDRKKEEKEADFINGLENRINELTFANEELDTKIRELTRAVYATQHQMQELTVEIKEKNSTQTK
ncbi:optic atrophy 3 protein homolog isoform X4 [Macrobrachium rosenbergii]|uniref:optic atrophy 3 protein homolog isoform X4 n=1 Tax=Macrobrachium rosenbergii TaxID=79674 RepID=UPI0034D684E9